MPTAPRCTPAALLSAVASIPEGERNDTLNKCAYGLVRYIRAGALDPFEAEDELSMAASYAGLDDHEISATIASAWRVLGEAE